MRPKCLDNRCRRLKKGNGNTNACPVFPIIFQPKKKLATLIS